MRQGERRERSRIGIVLALAACLAGCDGGPKEPEGPKFAGVRLEVVAVGDPAILEAVRVQSSEWARTNGVTLELRPEPVGPDVAKAADVVVFPGRELGNLVDADALVVVPESIVRPTNLVSGALPLPGSEPGGPAPAPAADPMDFDDVSQPYRELVSRYGEDRLGLPLGGSLLVLAYRRDALGESQREAAASAGVSLAPPKTWEELDALARFLHGRDWDGDGEPESGLALALGDDPEGVGTAAFLARAATLGQPPDRYDFLFDAETMVPRVDTPPFVEALEKVVAWKDCGPEGMATFDAKAARAAFRAGEVALLIDRAERAAEWTDPKRSFPVSVAPLPGSLRLFEPSGGEWRTLESPNRPAYLPVGGGWLAGVSAGATGKGRDAALEFLGVVAGAELSGAIISDPAFPMVPVRESHWAFLPYQGGLNVDASSWGASIRESLEPPRLTVGLRVPEADGYLHDLDAARASALAGTAADEALAAASKSWAERTERLGPERQKWHYRRSLNALTTADEPPPR